MLILLTILGVYCIGHDYVETYLPNDDDELSRLAIDDGQQAARVDQGAVPRFRIASKSEYQLQRYFPAVAVCIIWMLPVTYHLFCNQCLLPHWFVLPPTCFACLYSFFKIC